MTEPTRSGGALAPPTPPLSQPVTPTPADDAERDRRLALTKRRATGLLIACAGVLAVAALPETRWPWLGYLRAATEAAAIGGPADWFAVTAVTRPAVMANGVDAYASGAFVMAPLLRAQTPTRYPAFAVPGVHANVLLAAQSRRTIHVTPSKTHHLYCSGATPPVAVAVHVMLVPVGCGAALSAATVNAVTCGAVLPVVVNDQTDDAATIDGASGVALVRDTTFQTYFVPGCNGAGGVHA